MLKNPIQEPTLFFDLEWVPDAAGAMRLYDLPAETSELTAMERIWQETSGYHETDCPRPFVKYLLSRVVSIAFLSRKVIYREGERHIEFGLHSLPKLPLEAERSDEREIIERFLYIVGERSPQLVGFNSVESDLQVLIQRSLVNEIRAEKFNERPDKPWDGRDYFHRYAESHLDIIKLLSPNNMKPTLNSLARLCGFPGKIDINGMHVVDLWLDGRLKEIVEYNQIDALNTYLVWLRVVNFAGKLSEEAYLAEQDDFREFIEKEAEREGADHLRRFIDRWDS